MRNAGLLIEHSSIMLGSLPKGDLLLSGKSFLHIATVQGENMQGNDCQEQL
jgi:hypothetical protein